MATIEVDLDALRRHVGRRQVATDVVTATPANLLRLTLERPDPELNDGDVLPPGWTILYFLPRFLPHELRADGAPANTGVVPAMPLPRRMFAGQTFRFHRPIRIGQTLTQETELTDISVKRGATARRPAPGLGAAPGFARRPRLPREILRGARPPPRARRGRRCD